MTKWSVVLSTLIQKNKIFHLWQNRNISHKQKLIALIFNKDWLVKYIFRNTFLKRNKHEYGQKILIKDVNYNNENLTLSKLP